MAQSDLSFGKRRHALVIGGSLAGLLAARVLSEHFEHVTIVERDRFPEGPIPRKGVPQSRHVHALLKRGRITLERLFPGIEKELQATGAPILDMAADVAWLTPAGWGLRFPSNLAFITFSRDLLDWSLRRRLTTFEGVRFLQERDVTGLLSNRNGSCVRGVLLRPRDQPPGAKSEESLRADLVVDASGRTSRVPKWLEALGYKPPQETMIDAHMGYASRIYRRPSGFQADWKMLIVHSAPPAFKRGGLLQPIEGDRWMVTLTGGERDYPPTDERGFMEFARSLRSPLLYEAIKDAHALSPISGYRATQNRRRHYEKLSSMPENLLITGDAACAFNPVYAQGMATAALGTEVLEESLREQRRLRPAGDFSGLGRRFQKKLARVNSAPWTLATGQDFRYEGTEGGKASRLTRLMHRYMDEVLLLSTEDAGVRLVLLEAFNLLKAPTTLFRLAIVARVVRRAAMRRRQGLGDVKAPSVLPELVSAWTPHAPEKAIKQ